MGASEQVKIAAAELLATAREWRQLVERATALFDTTFDGITTSEAWIEFDARRQDAENRLLAAAARYDNLASKGRIADVAGTVPV